MAIYYVDPEDGNDGNSGLTFALRKRTLSAWSAQDGDEIRFIASRTPTAHAGTAFTKGTDTVVLPAAKTQNIFDCDTAWTASANVTCSTSTTNYVQGTACSTITPATAFTTGKLAYKAVGSIDLSGYEAFSCMVTTTGTLAGAWTLRLCSDTTGDTVVASVAIAATNGRWRTVYFDGVSSLGTIQSISLFTTSDPGTVPLFIDNIVACRHKNHADHISHQSLVGKNTVGEPEWYPILAIDDATLTIRATTNPKPTAASAVFRGATETTTGYTFLPLLAGTGSDWTTNADRISGGWNRTDMSTQTGVTWMSGRRIQSPMMSCAISGWTGNGDGTDTERYDVTLTNMGFCHMAGPISCQGTGLINPLGFVDCNQTTHMFQVVSGSESAKYIKTKFINMFNCPLVQSHVQIHAAYQGANTVFDIDRVLNCTSALPVVTGGGQRKRYYYIRYMAGVALAAGVDPYATGAATPYANACIRVHGTTFEDVTTVARISNAGIDSEIHLINCNGVTDANVSNLGGTIFLEYFDGDDQRAKRWLTGRANGTIAQDETEIHGSAVTSWKFVGNAGAISPLFPDRVLLGHIAVNGGSLVTVNCWVKTTAVTAFGGIGTDAIDGKPGVPTQVSYAASTLGWEQVTITFTPTIRGIVPIYGYIKTDVAAPSPTLYFSDLTYSQA